MKESQLLKLDQAVQLLCDAAETSSAAVISYLKNGKWQNSNATLCEVAADGLEIEMKQDAETDAAVLPVNQPVGMSLQFEHIKYIFETRITNADQDISHGQSTRYTVALPDRIEIMQRRAYDRVPIPRSTNVSVTFWHRGYNDAQNDAPTEDYWQANVVDLSAGGLMMSVKDDAGRHFRENQYLGLQFTPMCYQKPLTLEGKINRLDHEDETGKLNIAVEFLGLEASSEGREKIHRLISVVNTFSMQNKGFATAVVAQLAAEEAATTATADAPLHEHIAEFSE